MNLTISTCLRIIKIAKLFLAERKRLQEILEEMQSTLLLLHSQLIPQAREKKICR